MTEVFSLRGPRFSMKPVHNRIILKSMEMQKNAFDSDTVGAGKGHPAV